MIHLQFPTFERSKHKIQNVNEMADQQASFGERAADKVVAIVGSWQFIIVQSVILVIWIILNVTAVVLVWDPYPFILMNLVLSTQAAFTAPIIMMSQNRQSTIDRIEAHNDYVVNQKSATELDFIMQQLEAQNKALIAIHDLLKDRFGEDSIAE